MQQQPQQVVSPALPVRYHRPAWAFSKPGKAMDGALMMGLPHHLSMVDYDRMLAFLMEADATNGQAYRILSRANPSLRGAVYIRADMNRTTQGGDREALLEAIRSLQGMDRRFYSNNKLVLDLAKKAGLLVYPYSARQLDMNEVDFTALYITKDHGKGHVREMTRSLFEGRRIAAIFY